MMPSVNIASGSIIITRVEEKFTSAIRRKKH